MPHRNRSRFAVLAGTLSLAAPAAPAQCLDWLDGLEEDEGGANSQVVAVAPGELGGAPVAFLGGSFQQIGGILCKGLVAWDGQTWTALDGWHQGSPTELVWLDDGSGPALFAVGGFYLSDGAPRTNVLRFRNGQWDDLHAGTGDQGAYAAIAHDGMLVVSGGFTSVDGQPTKGLAAWNGSSWLAFPDGPDGPVWAMTSYDDGSGPALIVGGAFSSVGGLAAANVASYRDGVWSAMGAGLTGGQCRALCEVPEIGGPGLYAGGTFLWSGGDRVTHIARWNGAAWTRLGGSADDGGGTNGRVDALGVLPGQFFSELLVAGPFDGTNGGPDVRGIATWNAFDAAWGDLRAGIGTTDMKVAAGVSTAHGARVIAGGAISDQGGKPAKNVAIWGVPCAAPTVVESPVGLTAPFDSWVEFNVHAHGSMPLEYMWLKDGLPLVADERVKGVDSTRLTISPWRYDDGGVYECLVTNEFGLALSDPATLTIPGGNLPHVPIQTLTLTEVESPFDPNRTIGLRPTSVASDGGVALAAGNSNGDRHVLSWFDGSLVPIASLGDPLPGGAPEEVLSGLDANPVTGPGGTLVFGVTISGPDVEPENDTALCYFDGQSLRTLFREGNQAPGMDPGVLIGGVGAAPAFTEAGDLILANGLVGLTYEPDTDSALWKWSEDAGFALVAASQQTPPGLDAPWTWLGGGPVLGRAGRAFIFAGLDSMTGHKNFPYPDRGVWIESDSAIVPVARSGDHAPGFAPDVNFELFRDPAALPNVVYFSSRVAGPGGFDSFGLWSWSGSGLQTLVIEGDPLPPGPPQGPPGGEFVWPDVLRGNANDAVVFSSVLESDCGSDCANRGVFLAAPGRPLRPLAYNRAPALSGMEDGLTVEGFTTHLIGPRNHVVIETGFDSTRYLKGLLGWDPLRGLFPIIVPGTRIEVEPGVSRVVLNATLARTYEPDPLTASGLDDAGMVTVNVEFTDWPGALVRASWTEARDASFPCRADVNGDGALDTRDVVEFLNLWAARDWGADFSDDGRVDTIDVIAFLNAWTAGC